MSKIKFPLAEDIIAYNENLEGIDNEIGVLLATTISKNLPEAENKLWHSHPVWFIEGNPVAGYSKQKNGMRLMFWSGQSFEEDKLEVRGGKFKDASIFYNNIEEINKKDLKRWIAKSRDIQWDYKNIIKRKGVLKRIK